VPGTWAVIRWLRSTGRPDDAAAFELVHILREVTLDEQRGNLSNDFLRQLAPMLCRRFLGSSPARGQTALEWLRGVCDKLAQMHSAPGGLLHEFFESSACEAFLERHCNLDDAHRQAASLVWGCYHVPDDCRPWLLRFIAMAERFPACIVLSDMNMSGNPMFFVNKEFCRVTGYSKAEAQGRNCRFLQGAKTEPSSVSVIRDTLRRGTDCFVQVTNYRKDGSLFPNLLSMKPIFDSNGVYRFCVGVQFEVTPAALEEMPVRLYLLEQLLRLVPEVLPVSGEPAGPRFVSLDGADGHLHRSSQYSSALNLALSGYAKRSRREADARAGRHAALYDDGWAKMRQAITAAREEAGLKLRKNHDRVLQDVTNPGPFNIDEKMLTQLELQRITSEADRPHVDAALREIARRLLEEVDSEPSSLEQAMVWAATAKYLDGRIQATPDEKPGREPDMSAEAAQLFRGVLLQLMCGHRC